MSELFQSRCQLQWYHFQSTIYHAFQAQWVSAAQAPRSQLQQRGDFCAIQLWLWGVLTTEDEEPTSGGRLGQILEGAHQQRPQIS